MRRFTGGLNRQIEHHLFPTLPRHNLHKAQVLVRALCSKHGLYYEVRCLRARPRCVRRDSRADCSAVVCAGLLHVHRHHPGAAQA